MRHINRIKQVKKALTLLEMVLAMAITAVVFAVILLQITAIQNSWSSKKGFTEVIQNGRVLMDHFAFNLARAEKVTAVSDSGNNSGYINFIDNQGQAMRYEVGDNGYVRFGAVNNLSDLAGPVSQLQFTCYDACDLNAAITDVFNIRSVKAQAAFTNSASNGRNISFTSQVYLRTNSDSNTPEDTVTPGIAVSNLISVANNDYIGGINGCHIAVSTNSTAASKITVSPGTIDGDAYVGPGGNPNTGIVTSNGGVITGTRGALSEAVAIPAITLPDLGASVGNRTYSSGTTTISTNLHCGTFQISNTGIVRISGDVVIMADSTFTIRNSGQLQLLSGATLTLYTKNTVNLQNSALLNANTADYSKLIIYHSATQNINITGSATAYATILAPSAKIAVTSSGRFYGTFKGKNVEVSGNGKIYTTGAGGGGGGMVSP